MRDAVAVAFHEEVRRGRLDAANSTGRPDGKAGGRSRDLSWNDGLEREVARIRADLELSVFGWW